MVNAHKQTQQLAEVPSSWAHPVERYACQNGHLPRSMMKNDVYLDISRKHKQTSTALAILSEQLTQKN